MHKLRSCFVGVLMFNSMCNWNYFVRDCFVCFLGIILSGTVWSGNFFAIRASFGQDYFVWDLICLFTMKEIISSQESHKLITIFRWAVLKLVRNSVKSVDCSDVSSRSHRRYLFFHYLFVCKVSSKFGDFQRESSQIFSLWCHEVVYKSNQVYSKTHFLNIRNERHFFAKKARNTGCFSFSLVGL